MKIGIISDTHKKVRRTEKAVDFMLSGGAEYFIHAGDIGLKENLEVLNSSGKPFSAVFGNNDAHLYDLAMQYSVFGEPHIFSVKETALRFKLMHLPFYLGGEFDGVVIFGHTHSKHISKTANSLLLNPGECCARDTGHSECMLLEVNDKSYTVEYCYRKVGEVQWNAEIRTFER